MNTIFSFLNLYTRYLRFFPARVLAVCCCLIAGSAGEIQASENGEVQVSESNWHATQLDNRFRSEGVAVADVNQDGLLDVLAGELWYAAPDWKAREIATPGDYGDGKAGYSTAFLCFANDVNQDGWPDLIVIGFPGAPCHWYENPQNRPGHWAQHEIWHSACNETPLFCDLFDNGQPVLIMGWQPTGQSERGQMAWFAPAEEPRQLWKMHPISQPSSQQAEIPGTRRFSHGLGVGDINQDGRKDVICLAGWWEQPEQVGDQPWTFHAADLGDNCANMYADDVTGDGIADVLSSSAHDYGIWVHVGARRLDGGLRFVTQALFPKLISQTHALHYTDLTGDGLADLVTGKRWWAHGPSGDPGSDEPALLYCLEASRDGDGVISFRPQIIHHDSGVGTQFAIADLDRDGKQDVVTSNKKGVFVFQNNHN